MALRAERLQREAAATAGSYRPLIDLTEDLRADISKTTTHVTHEGIIFELHGLKGKIARYYGSAGHLVRESDERVSGYPLIEGTIQIGFDHGMIIGRILWKGRLYLIGAPPGYAISREEWLSP